MRWFKPIIVCVCALAPQLAWAKPIIWPGGFQVMSMNDQDMNSLHTMYTFSPKWSVTVRADYMDDGDTTTAGVEATTLLKRWNFPNAQANIYVGAGVGGARSPDDSAPAFFGDILADYETRRVFVSYEADAVAAGDVTNQLWHRGRVGIAPYVGEYDDLHTWLMLQTDVRPNMDDEVTVTPMVRLFKTDWMVEGGVSNRGDTMANLIFQF